MWVGRWIAALVAGMAASACGSSLPRAPASPHTPDELVEVPYPPPVVRADVVPPRTHPDAVWVDGEWLWLGARWAWHRGAWIVPPEGATLAPWETRRDGARVLHAASVFHLPGGGTVSPSELQEGDPRRRKPVICAPPASSAPARVADDPPAHVDGSCGARLAWA
jgi:hypothetical protein